MTEPRAFVVVCDDVRVENSGKLLLLGTYTADIAIPAAFFVVPRLNFFFIIEVPAFRHVSKITCAVTLPGGSSQLTEQSFGSLQAATDRSVITFRQIVSFSNPTLMPGRIEARIYLDQELLMAEAPAISIAQ